MPLTMHCRFARDEHGTFANAVLLQQHYLAEHADVYVPPAPRQCPECDAQVSATQLSAHRRTQHGVTPTGVGRPRNGPKISKGPFSCDFCGKVMGSRDTARHHVRDSHGDPGPWRDYMTPVGEQSPNGLATVEREVSTPRHVGPWTVDDIVLPVVEQLAAPRGMIPVAHLAAILAWRDATSAMLSAVTGPNR